MSEPKFLAPPPFIPPHEQPQYQNPYPQSVAYPQPFVPVPPPAPQATGEDEGTFCDACGEIIGFGEQCVELFMGKLSRGQKSGQPVVVADDGMSSTEEMPPGILHLWCVKDYYNHFVDDADDPPPEIFCASCDVKISGDG